MLDHILSVQNAIILSENNVSISIQIDNIYYMFQVKILIFQVL